jgi:hypothetical protein
MTTSLENAFPLGANFVAATIRSEMAKGAVAVFDTAALATEDFTLQPYRAIAVRGPNGAFEIYSYDQTDTTTADDGGVSCIVVSGRRYIKRIDVIVRDSALSATEDTQPVSPTLGDTYIIPAAPSGTDWASEAKTVATYTARGWIFRQPFVGMVVYVEDEEEFYHYDPNGDWVLGMGAGALPDGSVRPKKLFFPFGQIKVVDQRNAPPGGTPTNGTAYQVGTSPTGLFTGHANDIAIWNSAGAGSWEFFDPVEGDEIYRLDIGTPYTYRSGVWGRTVAAPVVVQSHYVDDVSVTSSTASLTNRLSSPSITAAVGQKIRATVYAQGVDASVASGSGTATAGIRIDSAGATTKTIWSRPITSSEPIVDDTWMAIAEIDVPDASAHIYRIATQCSGVSSPTTGGYTMRAIFEVITPT